VFDWVWVIDTEWVWVIVDHEIVTYNVTWIENWIEIFHFLYNAAAVIRTYCDR
jgi:hypothetical protein